MTNKGKIHQVISAVVDVKFKNSLPAVLNALECSLGDTKLIFEVAQHLGDGVVRCISMDGTDGLEVIDTGYPIRVPVGIKTLGRILNVIGKPIDNKSG